MGNSQTVGLTVTFQNQFSAAFSRFQSQMNASMNQLAASTGNFQQKMHTTGTTMQKVWSIAEAVGAWYTLGRAVDVVTDSYNTQNASLLQLSSTVTLFGQNQAQMQSFAQAFAGTSTSIAQGAQMMTVAIQGLMSASTVRALTDPNGSLARLLALHGPAGVPKAKLQSDIVAGIASGNLTSLGQSTGLGNTFEFYQHVGLWQSMLSSPVPGIRLAAQGQIMAYIERQAAKTGNDLEVWHKQLGYFEEKQAAAWETLKGALGRAIAPMLAKIISYMSTLTDKITSFVNAHPGFVRVAFIIGVIAASIMTIVAAVALLNPLFWVMAGIMAGIAVIVATIALQFDRIAGVFQLLTTGAMSNAIHNRLEGAGALGGVTKVATGLHYMMNPTELGASLGGKALSAILGNKTVHQGLRSSGLIASDEYVRLHPDSVDALTRALTNRPVQVSLDGQAIHSNNDFYGARDSILRGQQGINQGAH